MDMGSFGLDAIFLASIYTRPKTDFVLAFKQ